MTFTTIWVALISPLRGRAPPARSPTARATTSITLILQHLLMWPVFAPRPTLFLLATPIAVDRGTTAPITVPRLLNSTPTRGLPVRPTGFPMVVMRGSLVGYSCPPTVPVGRRRVLSGDPRGATWMLLPVITTSIKITPIRVSPQS